MSTVVVATESSIGLYTQQTYTTIAVEEPVCANRAGNEGLNATIRGSIHDVMFPVKIEANVSISNLNGYNGAKFND
jgi:hypothetical protein